MATSSSLFIQLRSTVNLIIILLAVGAAYLIYTYVLGNPANFVDGNPLNEPLKNNYLGVIHKGGPIVILLLTFQITLISFVIERFFSLSFAKGRRNHAVFVQRVKALVREEKYQTAMEACDQQHGSIANVLRNGLHAYITAPADAPPERKLALIERDIEEATQLELPQLNKNMVIISTLASISTLIGLLGTVTGMIKAFAALARVGAPDAVGLASGISQALVTTALGISTAAVAIVFFNYFSSRIDAIVYAIDETTFSLINSFRLKLTGQPQVAQEATNNQTEALKN